ncbi:hypothetical protein QBC34DRAFT_60612 [Podospora aff. communis PSN243]|uniref:Lysine-specific metallo-endopeptidase domain-containing protein n=1 Tax=Podospora aff. communis PSN243 TaxID=3040156 RepID=A0AAV9GR93_9PEZI|nr:hypothetical protein QBC34DRAFT_60612 [Podospora aff. communis PSN243]
MCSLRRLLAIIAAGIPAIQALSIPRDHASQQAESSHQTGSAERYRQLATAKLASEIEMPGINPPFNEEYQNKRFHAILPSQSYRHRDWNRTQIPKYCLEEALYNHLTPSDVLVRDVWFEDCPLPWTICRHKDAKESWSTILTTFSQVPVGMRSYISNLLILPSTAPGMKHVAAYTRGSVLVFTPSYFRLGVLFHEFSHILDNYALRTTVVAHGYKANEAFSSTAMWTRALLNDSALPTPYARSTLQENFADAGRWAMSDMTSAGGLAEFSKGWEGCKHQIRTFEQWMGEVIFPKGGRCVVKKGSSEAVLVPMGVESAAPVGGRPRGGLGGLDGAVEELLESPERERNMFVYSGPPPAS